LARELIRKGLANTIKKGRVIDYVYGIPSAGIAPATLLARQLNVPLLVQHKDEYYSIDLARAEEFLYAYPSIMHADTDVIAGTVPFGIILGLILAEIQNKPFIFVREKAKDHGTQQQIEGIYTAGSWATLISPYFDKGYTQDAKTALEASGIDPIALLDERIQDLFEKVTYFEGKTIVGVEDLISSGESMIGKIDPLLKKGATVMVRAIFNYKLPTATKNFLNYGLDVVSLVDFEELKEELYMRGLLTDDEYLKLQEWFIDQVNWGTNHGFPPPTKK